MRSYRNLVNLLFNQRRASPAALEYEIGLAYQRVFTGSPSQEDQAAVLVDLANYSGFYRVTEPSPAQTRDNIVFNEGMRATFARVFSKVRMSGEENVAFETAVRQTAAIVASANEGE